jgi:hypothetical protein
MVVEAFPLERHRLSARGSKKGAGPMERDTVRDAVDV